MKYFLGALLATMLVMGNVFAGEGHKAPQYNPVQSYDFGLEMDRDGGKVKFSWDEFTKNENIKWWKLVHSKTSSNISYPENSSRYLGDSQSMTESVQWFDAGKYYVRLCAVTHSNNRYCGEVKTLSFTEEAKKVEQKKKHVKEYKKVNNNAVCTREYAPVCGKTSYGMKTYSNKCVMKSQGASYVSMGKCEMRERKTEKKEMKKTSKAVLSDRVKDRIDELLENFLERLEDKGYSNEKMLSSINTVVERLKKLESNKKYTMIVKYMIEVLEEEKTQYDSGLDGIEKVFEGL